jgi:hypothetical protein
VVSARVPAHPGPEKDLDVICFLRTFALCVLVLAAGCTTRHRVCAPPELARESGLVQPGAEDASGGAEAELLRSFADRTRTANAPCDPPPRPGKFLALSAGGMYGAYSVGVLSGWTAAGTRPEFDVVTGVSTGALIATFAFLGSDYDPTMVKLYTSVSSRDIYRRRPLSAIVWSDSAASSAPLKKLIDCHVDDALVAAVAKAHESGRRLYVGTTNIDTRKLVIWDMGAIAASSRPDAKELFRKILLASASVPGFFPPVPIEVEVNGKTFTEMHVDGGATTGVFLRASTLHLDPAPVRAGRQPLAGSDVYVIVAGKLYADPVCTDRRTVRIGEGALNSIVYSQIRGELFRIYALSVVGGMNYHLAAVPEDFKVVTDPMEFDPQEMRRFYDAGYAAVTDGRAWRDTPPGAEPQEQPRPRTGTQFYAPGAQPR